MHPREQVMYNCGDRHAIGLRIGLAGPYQAISLAVFLSMRVWFGCGKNVSDRAFPAQVDYFRVRRHQELVVSDSLNL
jgi:hypothetical protein